MFVVLEIVILLLFFLKGIYVGAFFRWTFFLFKKKYSYYLEDRWAYLNIRIAVLVLGGFYILFNSYY